MNGDGDMALAIGIFLVMAVFGFAWYRGWLGGGTKE